jgi:hypothetical protein
MERLLGGLSGLVVGAFLAGAAWVGVALGQDSGPVTARGGQTTSEAERVEPVSYDAHFGRPARRRLPITFTTGICADAVRFSVLRQRRSSVAVRFDEVFRGDARPCPAIAKQRCVTVILRSPLRGRRVIDAARGVRIPRRSGDPGGQACPRVGRPPVDLPPTR